tara:strand:+ start:642 stop:2426 length:1785 start_codon:yes stop_codon:yes gene_type:complete
MKIRELFFFCLFSSLILPQEKKIIAVANITSTGISETQKTILHNRLETELVNLQKYNVTTRSEVDKILKEQKFQQSGCTEQACAAEIGRMLNADEMLLANIIYDKESKYASTTLKLVDVQNAVIVAAITKDKINASSVTQIFPDIAEYILELYRADSAESVVLTQSYDNDLKEGEIKIVTDPVGANIIIDSKPYGVSPLKLKIQEGRHRLNLTMNGYERKTENFNAVADTLIELNYSLSKQTGNLMIVTNPKGAKVYLNEKYYGESPLELQYLEVGEYFLSIVKKDYEEFSNKIRIDFNSDATVNKDLIPMPATVAFFSTPNGANVFVNNKLKGKTKESGLILNLPKGKHEIKMKLKSYYEKTQFIDLLPGEKTDFEFSLSPLPLGVSDDPNNGWASISTEPKSSTIKIHNTKLDNPLKYHELRFGVYSYSISEYGFRPKSGKLKIKKQKHTKLDIKLEKYDYRQSKNMSYVFPGLGHLAAGDANGYLWTTGGFFLIYLIQNSLQNYNDKIQVYDDAYAEYLSAVNIDDIALKSDRYRIANDEKNASIIQLGGSVLLLGGYWFWNTYDLDKLFEKYDKFYLEVARNKIEFKYDF